MIEPLILRPDEGILTRYPQLAKMAAELSDIYADREKLVTDNALQLIGTLLWCALDADELFQQASKRAGQHFLPIVIESGKPEILHLPWETLYHPVSGFLGRSEGFTLSRAMPSTGAVLPAIEDGPLRVLLFTALPDDIGEKEQLRIEDEQALVLEALGQWRQSGHVLLEMPDDGRFSEFTHQLHHFRPHLVYLSGHGKVIVQGALAQRGIAVKFIESWLDREIGQRAVAQMGWVRNLAILGGYLITSGAVTATMKLELGI